AITVQPFAAYCFANSSPMPELAPVIITVCAPARPDNTSNASASNPFVVTRIMDGHPPDFFQPLEETGRGSGSDPRSSAARRTVLGSESEVRAQCVASAEHVEERLVGMRSAVEIGEVRGARRIAVEQVFDLRVDFPRAVALAVGRVGQPQIRV